MKTFMTAAAIVIVSSTGAMALDGFANSPHPGKYCGKLTIVDDVDGVKKNVAVEWNDSVTSPGMPNGIWTTMNSLAGKHVTAVTQGTANCAGNVADGESPPKVMHIFESPIVPE